MKFTVEVDALQGALDTMNTVLTSGMGVQNLTCLISTKGKKELLVEASGEGVYAKQIIPDVKIEKEGQMAINVAYLSGLTLPGETVTMEVHKRTLTFACGRLKGKFDTLSEGDPVERIDSKIKTAVKMDAGLFSKLVDAILFKPTTQDASNELRFIASEKEGTFSVLTADSYRAARFKAKSLKDEKAFAKLFEEEPAKEEKAEKKGKEDKKKAKGKKAKEKKLDKEEMKEVVKKAKTGVLVCNDFDYILPASILIPIKSLFDGPLEVGTDKESKVIRMSDDFVTVYHPCQSQEIGAKVEDLLKSLKDETPRVEAMFDPDEAANIIISATSIAVAKEGAVTLVPTKDSIGVKVRADHAETKASFDCKVVGGKKKDKPFEVSSQYFGEFLDLINFFADKEGCRLRVWDKLLALDTKDASYIMPLLNKE